MDPLLLQRAIVTAVQQINKDQALPDIKTLEEIKIESMATNRLNSLMLAGFATVVKGCLTYPSWIPVPIPVFPFVIPVDLDSCYEPGEAGDAFREGVQLLPGLYDRLDEAIDGIDGNPGLCGVGGGCQFQRFQGAPFNAGVSSRETELQYRFCCSIRPLSGAAGGVQNGNFPPEPLFLRAQPPVEKFRLQRVTAEVAAKALRDEECGEKSKAVLLRSREPL